MDTNPEFWKTGINSLELLRAELEPIPSVCIDASMDEVFEMFGKYPECSFFPVVSKEGQPLGVLRESELRKYVFSSYGRSLLHNPVYTKNLRDLLSPCYTVDIHMELELIVRIFSHNEGDKGLLVEEDNRYIGFLNARSLLLAMNEKQMQHLTRLNRAFQRFVPQQFMELLEKQDITEVQLGHCTRKKMSILFSDIRSFTTLSEQMSPEENFSLLNTYLQRMEPTVVNNNGFIDKYMGDGIMALFDQTADDATQAAIQMIENLKALNQERDQRGEMLLKIGIGINTGMSMVGVIGGKQHMTSTVISDAVNLSSRVEQLTKKYGVSLLITEQTLEELENLSSYSIRFMDMLKVKGRSETIKIYEVYDGDAEELRIGKDRTRSIFEEACWSFQEHAYRKAWRLFRHCHKQNPRDEAAFHYARRCEKRFPDHAEGRNRPGNRKPRRHLKLYA